MCPVRCYSLWTAPNSMVTWYLMVKCLLLIGPSNTPRAFLKEYAIIFLDGGDFLLNSRPLCCDCPTGVCCKLHVTPVSIIDTLITICLLFIMARVARFGILSLIKCSFLFQVPLDRGSHFCYPQYVPNSNASSVLLDVRWSRYLWTMSRKSLEVIT